MARLLTPARLQVAATPQVGALHDSIVVLQE